MTKILEFNELSTQTYSNVFEVPESHIGKYVNYMTNSTLSNTMAAWSANVAISKPTANSIRANSPTEGTPTSYGMQHLPQDRTMKIYSNRPYTLTLDVRGNIAFLNYCYFMRPTGGNHGLGVNLPVSAEWNRVSITTNVGAWETTQGYMLFGTRNVAVGNWFEIRNVVVSQGSEAAEYSIAPLDNDPKFTVPDELSKIEISLNDRYTLLPNMTEIESGNFDVSDKRTILPNWSEIENG